MAQLWDKQPDAKRADAANPLPNPQLSPATNPILGKNLGRWAQVYYTNPPEKREQAVAELLRELESQASEIKPHAGAGKPKDEKARHQVVCPQCQRKNNFQQEFCSFCGSRLHPNRATASNASQNGAVSSRASAQTAAVVAQSLVAQPVVSQKIVAQPVVAQSVVAQSAVPQSGETAIQRARDQALSSADQPAVPAYPSWAKLLAAALAILLAGVAYLHWSSAHHSSANLAMQKAHAARTPAPAPSGQGPTTESPAQTINSADHSPSVSTETPGTEDAAQDLVLAQGYLAGVRGPRDSAEATKWLWKAVGKQNTRAALLLADLYLRGDGVARSCDQARLLLQAAAEKGNRDAGQRLRGLESNGCR